MTIERLETIAADLYKRAEEATPIIGGADKLDWMARHLEEIVEDKYPILQNLLQCDTSDEVESLLETEYDDFKHADEIEEDEAALMSGALDDDGVDREITYRNRLDAPDAEVVDTPISDDIIVDPVADVYGIDPNAGKTVTGETNRPEDRVKIEDTVQETDKTVAGEPDKRPEKETGIKHELRDDYINDRAAQPEYIDDNPPTDFQDNDLGIIIEEEIIIVGGTPSGEEPIEPDKTDNNKQSC